MAKSSKVPDAARSPDLPTGGIRQGGAMETDPQLAAVAGMSYESALSELETLIQQVEDGTLSLEAGIKAHRRAVLLLKHCESILNSAQAQIEEIAGRDLPPAPDETD